MLGRGPFLENVSPPQFAIAARVHPLPTKGGRNSLWRALCAGVPALTSFSPVLRGKEAWCAAACIPRHSAGYGDCRKDSLQRRGNALRPLSAGPCVQERLFLWGTHFVGNGALAVFAGVFFRPVFQCVKEREQGVGDACPQQGTPYGCGEYAYIHSPEITKYRCNNGAQERVEQPREPAPQGRSRRNAPGIIPSAANRFRSKGMPGVK